jgi:hypothetical protein
MRPVTLQKRLCPVRFLERLLSSAPQVRYGMDVSFHFGMPTTAYTKAPRLQPHSEPWSEEVPAQRRELQCVARRYMSPLLVGMAMT